MLVAVLGIGATASVPVLTPAVQTILPGDAAAASACSLYQSNIYVSGSRIYGFGQIQCPNTASYRTLRVCIIQEGVSKACGSTYGNALYLSSSPTCAVQYQGAYRSYALIKVTYSDGTSTYWQSATKYLPSC